MCKKRGSKNILEKQKATWQMGLVRAGRQNLIKGKESETPKKLDIEDYFAKDSVFSHNEIHVRVSLAATTVNPNPYIWHLLFIC